MSDCKPYWLPKRDYKSELNSHREKFHQFYLSTRWRKLRLLVLAEQPLCYNFDQCGNVAEEIHHVKPLRSHWHLRLSFDNLRGLCKSCHSKETQVEERERTAVRIEDRMDDLNNF